MKIIFRIFPYFSAFLFSISAFGQLSLTKPLICHDKDKYLRCYNDGNFILKFGNGNLKEFKTSDGYLIYSDVDKTITFIQKNDDYESLNVDTIQIIQLPKSIVLKKNNSSIEITSLKEIPKAVDDYGIAPYSINNVVRGFIFWSGDKYFKLEVWTFGKKWSWNVIMEDNSRRFAISYNGYRNNRVEHISIQDDNLRYGMSISMTFKTLKKLRRLESSYVDTVKFLDNGTPVIGSIALDKNYNYEYSKSGKLKTERTLGEIKLCDCN